MHINNKNKYILILGGESTQELDDATLTRETDLYYVCTIMEATVSYLLMSQKIYQFKGKDSEIKDCTLCLENISKNFTINNMEKTGLKQSVIFICWF